MPEDLTNDLANDSQRLRGRAAELRELAEEFNDPAEKVATLQVARDYENMAEHAEATNVE